MENVSKIVWRKCMLINQDLKGRPFIPHTSRQNPFKQGLWLLNELFLQKETKCSVDDSSGPTRFHYRSPLLPSSQQFRFSFYCSTHSPLSFGILALSITFCTCSASFSALKVVKINKNALILTTLWTSRCRIGLLCRRSIPKYFELSRNNTVAKVLLNLHCNFVAPCHYKSIVAWDITWSKTSYFETFLLDRRCEH